VRKTFDELAAATAGLFGPNDSKPLLVRAPVSFAALWLAPRLKTFLDAYPSIDVRLFSAVWTDVVRDESPEIDIRFGDGHWPGFKAELIVGSGSIAVCPRGMTLGRGDAARLRGLAARDLIHVTGPADLWRRLFQAAGVAFEPKGRAINVDTTAAALELSVAGVGPATVLECLAAPYLADGRLTNPVALVLPSAEAHYVLIADGRARHRPEMTLFRDWLLAQK
jgi:LysR family glycine cleavage system transcriptional activator